MKVNISASGADQVRANLQRIGATLGAQALAQTAEQVELYIEREAGRHEKTGVLNHSIFKKKQADGSWLVGHDPQRASYAKFVIEGTRPHVIVPKPFPFPVRYTKKGKHGGKTPYLKSKKSLRWTSGGRYVYAGKVHHPGYKGDNWIERAAALAPKQFAANVQRILNTNNAA